MKNDSGLTQEEFDELLLWLAPDRDVAGESYLHIREGLVRYFRTKGCYESQSLADETINRVARKLSALDTTGDLKHVTYFYGFAKNIFLEYLARLRKTPMQLEPNLVKTVISNEKSEVTVSRFDCLDDCMVKLKGEESAMIMEYFSQDRSSKFEARRRLAEQLNITMGNLHIKVYRVKNILRACIQSCLEKTQV